MIDYPPFRFARAELATLREQFKWVAAIAPAVESSTASTAATSCSSRPTAALDRAALEQRAARHGDVVLEGAALDRFVGNAPVIRDDYAPIDQWLDADKN